MNAADGIQKVEQLEARALAVARARKAAVLIIGATLVIAGLMIFAHCAGEKSARAGDRRAAVTQVLKQNTVALASADTVARARHAGVAAADSVAARVTARAAVAEAKYSAARAAYSAIRIKVGDVSNAPADTATLAAAVHAADTTIANADTTIAKKDSALTARTAEKDSLVADTVAIARQRELYHERADTLQHQLEQSDAGDCAKLCTIGKATVYTVAGVVLYNIGRQIIRALFVGPAKLAQSP